MMSSTFRTNESPIHSTPILSEKSKSARSFGVRQGSEILVFGRFTPFLDLRSPKSIINASYESLG